MHGWAYLGSVLPDAFPCLGPGSHSCVTRSVTLVYPLMQRYTAFGKTAACLSFQPACDFSRITNAYLCRVWVGNAGAAYTEKDAIANAWPRRGTQKTGNTYNQPTRPINPHDHPPAQITDHAPGTVERAVQE